MQVVGPPDAIIDGDNSKAWAPSNEALNQQQFLHVKLMIPYNY